MSRVNASGRDPVCGMTGVIERHGHWFCSEGCIAQFERRPRDSASSCHVQQAWRVLDPWVWVPVTGIVLLTIGRWWPSAAGASAIYSGYLRKMLMPIGAGLVIGGLVDHFVPRAYIMKLLSGPRKRVIARATLLGFLASTCSHGCLALSLELYRKGASIPAVVSFLLASPWASMSMTLILLGLFGLRGVAIVGCALAVAFITGLTFQQLDRCGLLESRPQAGWPEADFSLGQDVSRRVREYPWTLRRLARDMQGVVSGAVPLGRMVLGWIQFGLVLSATLGALVPHAAFERFLGPSVGGLMTTLLVAAVIEVCSEGTAPLAFELYRQTGALGNAFAFLMGGVVTDYTELGALWMTIGRRTVLWLLIVTLPLVMGLGALLNLWMFR